MSSKRTVLYDEHLRLGGKMVEFAGWEMPVQYSGVIAEHTCVRSGVGLFDVSHMGEIWVTGDEAQSALEYLTCNRVASLYDGKAQYSAILNETGGVVDDIIVYRFSATKFLLCVNASNVDADFEWLSRHNTTSATFTNVSAQYGQIAVQGPKAQQLLAMFVDPAVVAALKYFHFCEATVVGVPTIVARTGYTGEDGFEIFIPRDETPSVWRALLEKGGSLGVLPCGLGARDSLRLEAAYPLHGHELSPNVSALESGLSWIVKLGKGEFIGRAALASEQEKGVRNVLVGFTLQGAGIARMGDGVAAAGLTEPLIGHVTSGTKTPTVQVSLGLARVRRECSAIGTEISCVVRGRGIEGTVVPLPFYSGLK
jgi:aminomethyltransferase